MTSDPIRTVDPAAPIEAVQVARERHPATANLLRFFHTDHLPEHLQPISEACRVLAMADRLDDSPELTAGLRNLLQAKDCFVRAALPG